MMVVVTIIIFLASVAVPRLFKYSARAKQAEVALILASLHTAQQIHKSEYGTYSTQLGGPDGVGWQPDGYNNGKNPKFYYTYGFYFLGAEEGVHYFTGKLGTPPEKLGECYAEKNLFVARAAGNIESNSKTDVWKIDEERNLVHENNLPLSAN